ncbi:Ribonuclease H-like superfamily [Sesbania bispinosa]|nr:Ribonuclease H-like superfamily [Sesbania bispinosa]
MGLSIGPSFFHVASPSDWIFSSSQQHGTLFLSTLWWIWKSRNTCVFYNVISPVWEIIHSALSLDMTCNTIFNSPVSSRVIKRVKWDPPCLDQISLNTDDSVIDNKVAFGGLLRDHLGDWIQGFYGSMETRDVLGAELMAILKGLHICWELSYKDVKCMTDSLPVVSLIEDDVS